MNKEIGRRIAGLLDAKNEGNQSDLARYVGVSPQAVQQWIAGKTVPKGKNLDALARFFNVAPGFILFGIGTADSASVLRGATNNGTPGSPLVVPIMNAAASMGAGEMLPEHDAVVGGLTLDRSWVRRNLSISAPENLAVISGFGNSMEPTYKDGDLLLVDRGVTTVNIDGVYVFEQGQNGERVGYIKTLQRRPDGSLRAISDNKTYDAWDIPKNSEFRVLGRIVWAWNGKKL